MSKVFAVVGWVFLLAGAAAHWLDVIGVSIATDGRSPVQTLIWIHAVAASFFAAATYHRKSS